MNEKKRRFIRDIQGDPVLRFRMLIVGIPSIISIVLFAVFVIPKTIDRFNKPSSRVVAQSEVTLARQMESAFRWIDVIDIRVDRESERITVWFVDLKGEPWTEKDSSDFFEAYGYLFRYARENDFAITSVMFRIASLRSTDNASVDVYNGVAMLHCSKNTIQEYGHEESSELLKRCSLLPVNLYIDGEVSISFIGR